MTIPYCHVCNRNPSDKAAFGDSGFENGLFCPVCHRPVCEHHLTTVRWRWKTNRNDVGAAQVCRHCRKTFEHRNWDTLNRDWVT